MKKLMSWEDLGLAAGLAYVLSAIVLTVLVVMTLVGCSSGPVDEPEPVTTFQQREEVTPTPSETEESQEFTVEQEQAIGSAEDYLSFAAFSRTGLIEQLVFEGFSESDATFAVDYLEVDWMEQAVQSAKDYLDISHFSHAGLVEQLEYEGFTNEQAEYGVTKAGL